MADGARRVAGELGRGAHGVAGEGGQRGRLGPLADDVADHQHPTAGAAEDVVEVATDLAELARRHVGHGGRPAGTSGSAGGSRPCWSACMIASAARTSGR